MIADSLSYTVVWSGELETERVRVERDRAAQVTAAQLAGEASAVAARWDRVRQAEQRVVAFLVLNPNSTLGDVGRGAQLPHDDVVEMLHVLLARGVVARQVDAINRVARWRVAQTSAQVDG